MIIERTQSMHSFEMFVKCATSAESDENRNKIKRNIPVKSWLREWCTYRFGMHRQSGHTINSIYILPRYFHSTLFLYHNDQMVRYAKDYFYEMTKDNKEFYEVIGKGNKVNFMSIISFNSNGMWDGISGLPNCVCVDVASMLSKTITENIFDTCCDILHRNKRKEFKLFFIE